MASVKTSQLRVRDYGFFLYHLAAARELVVKFFLLKLLSGPFGRTEGRPSVSECLTTFSRMFSLHNTHLLSRPVFLSSSRVVVAMGEEGEQEFESQAQ